VVPCLACGRPVKRPIDRPWIGKPITGGEVLGCGHCGSARVVPLPSQDASDVYTQTYYENFIARGGFAGGVEDAAPVLKARLAALEQRMQPGRIVDVGCAMGTFVAHANSRGWDATGVEPSAWAAAEARRRYGVEVHCGTLESATLDPSSVDVVHANHVVEHLRDPLSTFAAAFRILRPHGLLVVEVPQELRRPLADRVFNVMKPGRYARPTPGPSYHLAFFTVRGLSTLARIAGFDVESARTVQRHHRRTASRFPLGERAKLALYVLEERLETAPNIELLAVKPEA
jgi:SAM-dependent methyltransferase